MDKTQLDPVAKHLIDGYLDAASYSRQFLDDHGMPPTLLAKAHHLRSVVQARLTGDDRFNLDDEWAEFGRVQWTNLHDGRQYILRSQGAVTIEMGKRSQSETLFDSTRYLKTRVTMLVYTFQASGLTLSVTGTVQRVGRRRLEATGAPTRVGEWPFADESGTTFDQDVGDVFEDLGDLRIEEEGDDQ